MYVLVRINRLVVMSSSHQKKAPTSEAFPCPECGKMRMFHVVETCRLEDGLTVRNLVHYKCRACGSRFFDDDAMHRIRTARVSHASLARFC